MWNRAEIGLCRISPGCLLSDSTAPAGWPRRRTRDSRAERCQAGRQACMPCWDSTEQGGNRTLFYFAWLALPPASRLATSFVGPGSQGQWRGRGQPGLGLSGNRPEGRLSQSRQPAQGSHHRDETEMAFPGRTRLRSPPLEPAGERARPTLALSKGHRAEMELWRNKKALDLRGHRTTPHRSGERRGYRSETESP